MMQIPFNMPVRLPESMQYIQDVMQNGLLCGDGYYSKKCQSWFEEKLDVPKTLLTTSCTHALEMAAILLDIKPGDEVIMPSYTFVSTANAFVLRGAVPVFVDVRPDTMNIDERLIEAAITEKTKAIVPVHYAGVGCEMDTIMELAERYGLFVVEDAAQGMMATYREKVLGRVGHMGCYSFHETKNYTSGEGGLLIINDERFVERAEIIREKGTNRSQFFRGVVDKYSWVDMGSSYLPSELNAAYLYAQLEKADEINEDRLQSWEYYYQALRPLSELGLIELPYVPETCTHNAHMFYIKCASLEERSSLIRYLKEQNVLAVFHYVPLHSSSYGIAHAKFHGEDRVTTVDSERLLRLPFFYGMSEEVKDRVIELIHRFYNG